MKDDESPFKFNQDYTEEQLRQVLADTHEEGEACEGNGNIEKEEAAELDDKEDSYEKINRPEEEQE